MSKPKLIQLACLLFVAASNTLSGQSPAFSNHIGAEAERAASPIVIERTAARLASESDHYAAMKFYERFLAIDTTDAALQAYAAEALAFNALERAEGAFQKILDRSDSDAAPTATLRLAETKYHLGKYEEAKALFQAALLKPAASQATIEAAQTGLENCDWAADLLKNSDTDAAVESLGEAVNSPYSDFAPVPRGDSLYFTSWRFPFEKDKHTPQRFLMRLMSQQGAKAAVPAADLNAPLRHTANLAFNRAGTAMFFSNGDFVNAADIRCELFMRLRGADGGWSAPIRLPETINLPGFSAAEPAVGRDDDGEEALYFVSDRPGGKGKRDLWRCKILGESGFSEPLNLDALNTPGNDVTPFFDAKTGDLYFSTDGRPTLGGYDIYRAKKAKTSGWAAPENLGHPTNSNLHDLYYVLADDGSTAYLASNRKGAMNLSEEACCLDIFKANLRRPQVLAVTFNMATGDSLSGVLIRLIETTGTNEEIKLDVPGNWSQIPARPKKTYLLIASKDGFEPDTLRFDAPPFGSSEILVKHLKLRPKRLILVVDVLDKKTKQPLPGATIRWQDISAFEAPNAPLKTGKNGGPLATGHATDPLSNKFSMSLDFSHNYSVAASMPEYFPDSAAFTTVGRVGADTIRQTLYLDKRNVVSFLSLELYFDNDEPEKRTMRTTTSKTYEQSYNAYYARRSEYVKRATQGLADAGEIESMTTRVEDFFEYDVKDHWESFNDYMARVHQVLETGDNIKVELLGYASPRAQSAYNKNLAARRVMCVKNEFNSWKNGLLVPYIKSGRLALTESGVGENPKVDLKTVSDNIANERESVFSPAASRERKVVVNTSIVKLQ